MNTTEMSRLNSLFEKMVADRANVKEQRELSQLYQEFINDGRDLSGKIKVVESVNRVS
jgi:hypothetical protein